MLFKLKQQQPENQHFKENIILQQLLNNNKQATHDKIRHLQNLHQVKSKI